MSNHIPVKRKWWEVKTGDLSSEFDWQVKLALINPLYNEPPSLRLAKLLQWLDPEDKFHYIRCKIRCRDFLLAVADPVK